VHAVIRKLRRVAKIQWRRVGSAIARRASERSLQARHGDYVFHYPSRSIVGRAVAAGIMWDAHLLGLVSDLPAEAIVCEIGSNIGASLLTMAAARDDLRFVCFEPSPRFLPYLRTNVELNGLQARVTIEETLVGPAGGVWELVSNESTASAVADRYDHHRPLESARVEAVALDSYFANRAAPSFVKIDTDGFEAKVLESARRILSDDHPALFIEYTPALLTRAGDDGDAVRLLLLQAGYTTADVYTGEGELAESGRPLELPLETDGYYDLLIRS
jgi:FkbM family methyltransferase